MSKRSRKKRLYVLSGIAVFVVTYVVASYLYFQVEAPGDQRGWGDALWYVLLNPTRLGFGKLLPETVAGRFIAFAFVIANVGIIGLVIGKAAQIFSDVRESRRRGHHGTKFDNHFIIFGWDDFGQKVAEQLIAAGRQIVAVTDDRESVEHIYDHFSTSRSRRRSVSRNVFVLHADYRNYDLLRHANIGAAMRVFINTGTGTDALITMLNIRERYGGIKAVARIENEELTETFLEAGFERVLVDAHAPARLTASYIFEPDVAVVALDLLATAKDEADYETQQYPVTNKSGLVGKMYGDVVDSFYLEEGVMCVGLARRTKDGPSELQILADRGSRVCHGDYLLMIVNGTHVELLRDRFGVQGDGVWMN